jgi:hypothetical protein
MMLYAARGEAPMPSNQITERAAIIVGVTMASWLIKMRTQKTIVNLPKKQHVARPIQDLNAPR